VGDIRGAGLKRVQSWRSEYGSNKLGGSAYLRGAFFFFSKEIAKTKDS